MCEGRDPGVYRTGQLERPLELRGEPGQREPFDPKTGDRVRVGLREVGDGAVQVVHWVAEKQRWFPIVELG
jgi:hypothetical protein